MHLKLKVDLLYTLLVYFTHCSVNIQMHVIGRKKLWKRSMSRLCTNICSFLDQGFPCFIESKIVLQGLHNYMTSHKFTSFSLL